MPLVISLDGRDVSKFVTLGSLQITEELTSQPDECEFQLSIPGENYAINPGLEITGTGWAPLSGVWTQSTALFRSGTSALRSTNTAGTSTVSINTVRLPCVSGETLYVRCWYRISGAFAASNSTPARLRVYFYNASNTVVTFLTINGAAPTTAWQMIEGVVTCPTDPTIVSASIAALSVGQTAGTMWFDDFYLSYDASFVQYLKEVTVIEDSDTKFGGVILDKNVSMTRGHMGEYLIDVHCRDYQYHLSRFYVTKVYLEQTAKQIVTDLFADSRLSGLGLTLSTLVDDGPVIPEWAIKYETMLEAIDRLANYVQFDWYLGFNKQLYFYDAVGASAPAAAWNLTSDLVEPTSPSAPIEGLDYVEDVSQLRNALYVEGGEAVSVKVVETFNLSYNSEADPLDAYIRRKVSNNKTVVFGSFEIRLFSTWPSNGGTLPELPSIGIDGIDDPADFDAMVNYNEGSFWLVPPFFDQGNTAFITADYLQITYRYRYPLLTYLEDAPAISTYGRFEHAAQDKRLTTRDNIETYATADLTYFKNPLRQLSYTTTRPGLVLGSQQLVTLPRLGINGDFLIQRIVTQYGDYLKSATPHQSINTYFKTWSIDLEGI